jgi:hypothetical protein
MDGVSHTGQTGQARGRRGRQVLQGLPGGGVGATGATGPAGVLSVSTTPNSATDTSQNITASLVSQALSINYTNLFNKLATVRDFYVAVEHFGELRDLLVAD